MPFRCNTGFTSDRADGEAHVHVRLFKRVTGDANAMMSLIRRELAAIDPAVPISEDYR